MHIILTHEQADFDALASQLGAHLLDESAVPVLPRRINRNVRAFLTLYGQSLPFIEARDLPAEPIATVTLVDTQSMISVKGMIETPRVFVVDHHSPRADLPPGWTLTTETLGATTTLFVEACPERGCVLSAVQATLMLLGIYEDTGGLTYTRTTARDIRVAAYLVEQGASLEIAADFLQHPLSLPQQALYDELRAAAETHLIHGHHVVLAAGDARGLQEEISTVAHKLRDLLEPDGLFLLAATRGGVQLIARSTNDLIDVGEIAAHFKGGGHDRASAALIRPESHPDAQEGEELLAAVKAELLAILPQVIRPAMTVTKIMSRGPMVIAPDTPVDEVAQRMQRYGYEGYPVVEGGQVIGLLTRRAVDRALAHKLNLTAASLMDAGSVTVQPDDSIEYLQNLMIDTGWGQVPVVSPENGEIIGIVTRTDLINTLAPEPKLPGYQNLAGRLETALPPGRLALLKAAARAAHEQSAALYIVGGFVRDLLLDRPSLDFDLVVEGDAILLARSLAKQYGGRVTSHARFGTAKWHIAAERARLAHRLTERFADPPSAAPELDPGKLPGTLDLVTARTEFYNYPTALPTVERGSIKLDLHRRDFTINTLALRLDGFHYGELHDYWGALNDLQAGLVRVLHSLSFVDDPTRMLRAVRFERRFEFKIETRTLELLEEARPLLARVSGDRIRHELDTILDEPSAARMLARLDELGLLGAIHPELKGDEWLYDRLAALPAGPPEESWGLIEDGKRLPIGRVLGYSLWMIRLAPGVARRIISRIKLGKDLASVILAACKLWAEAKLLVEARPSQVVARLTGVPALSLYALSLASDDKKLVSVLELYVSKWQAITPVTTGHDLRAMGLPPGPAYRHILKALRDAWLDGEVKNAAGEADLLKSLVAEHIPDGA